jgi:hypothetical protein
MHAALETFEHLDFAKAAAAVPSEELYDAWCAARDDAQFAYDAWRTAPWPLKDETHAVYSAAFDREAAAAELYRQSIAQAT